MLLDTVCLLERCRGDAAPAASVPATRMRGVLSVPPGAASGSDDSPPLRSGTECAAMAAAESSDPGVVRRLPRVCLPAVRRAGTLGVGTSPVVPTPKEGLVWWYSGTRGDGSTAGWMESASSECECGNRRRRATGVARRHKHTWCPGAAQLTFAPPVRTGQGALPWSFSTLRTAAAASVVRETASHTEPAHVPRSWAPRLRRAHTVGCVGGRVQAASVGLRHRRERASSAPVCVLVGTATPSPRMWALWQARYERLHQPCEARARATLALWQAVWRKRQRLHVPRKACQGQNLPKFYRLAVGL